MILRILIFTRKEGIYNSSLFISYSVMIFGVTIFYMIAMDVIYNNVGFYGFWGTYQMQFSLSGQFLGILFILIGSIRSKRSGTPIQNNIIERLEHNS